MSEATVQSIIVGGVAIASALLGGILPSYIEKRRDYSITLRMKLEELYTNIENWYNTSYSMLYTEFSLVLNKHINWDSYLDRIISMEKNGDYIKSEIVLYLYFNQFEEQYLNLLLSIQEVDRFIHSKVKETYLAGMDISVHKDEHKIKLQIANKCFKILKESMIKYAKTIK